MRPVVFATVLLLAVACAAPQETAVVVHWDPTSSYLDAAVPAGGDMILVRRTAVRNSIEVFHPDGTNVWRLFLDEKVTRTLTDGHTLYFVGEQSAASGHVYRTSLDRAPGDQEGNVATPISKVGNWTDLVFGPDGHVLAFESLFLARDVAPSAVKIWDLTANQVLYQDNFSYQYPVQARTLLFTSPIDRRVRAWRGNQMEEIGRINTSDNPPLPRPDGRWVAWFGPDGMNSALYLADEHGIARVFRSPLPEQAITWLGEDLLIAEQDRLSERWLLRRTSVPDGLVRAILPVPAYIVPTRVLGSPSGDFIGLPQGDGSILVRLADNFTQEFSGVSLSDWRFAPDGSRLYIITRDTLKVVALR